MKYQNTIAGLNEMFVAVLAIGVCKLLKIIPVLNIATIADYAIFVAVVCYIAGLLNVTKDIKGAILPIILLVLGVITNSFKVRNGDSYILMIIPFILDSLIAICIWLSFVRIFLAEHDPERAVYAKILVTINVVCNIVACLLCAWWISLIKDYNLKHWGLFGDEFVIISQGGVDDQLGTIRSMQFFIILLIVAASISLAIVYRKSIDAFDRIQRISRSATKS